jgi:hypothetical protein
MRAPLDPINTLGCVNGPRLSLFNRFGLYYEAETNSRRNRRRVKVVASSLSVNTRVSAWKQIANWRERQAVHHEKFQAASQSFFTAVTNAVVSQAQGLVEITTQRAVDRIETASKQKLASTQSAASALNLIA